jgi:hypothetical protein
MLSGCLTTWSLANVPTFVPAHAFEILLVVSFFLIHPWDDGRRVRIAARRSPPLVAVAVIVVAAALAFAVGSQSSNQFIYFEF